MTDSTRTSRLKAKLVLIGGGAQHEYQLLPGETVIGRSSSAGIQIDVPVASKFHCKIVQQGSAWGLIDLGSQHGTRVNGMPVDATALRHGDQIQIGGLTFYFCPTGAVPAPGSVEIIQPVEISAGAEVARAVPSGRPKLDAAAPAQTHRSGRRPKFFSKGKILAGVGVLLVLVFLGVWVFFPEALSEIRGGLQTIGFEKEQKMKAEVPSQEGSDQRDKARITALVARADALISQGDFAASRILLEEALAIDPESQLVRAKMVEAYMAEGKETGQRGARPTSPLLEPRPLRLYESRWAVIVGVDRYPNMDRRRQLDYAVSDAKAVEKLLVEDLDYEPARIRSLYNQDASKNDVLAALNAFLADAGEEDAVFVFFAGHGHTESTAYGDVGYILPHDGSLDPREMHRNISMTELSEISKRLKVKHVLFAMDCCYGGQLLGRYRASQEQPDRTVNYERLLSLTSRRVRQVLTAGGKGEEVLDGGPFGHSVFTGRFIEALRGNADINDDGFITAAELELYVGDRVFEDARCRGKQQNPQLGKLFSGEGMFVFETNKWKPRKSTD
jgi:uncharacterized caspase-like protein